MKLLRLLILTLLITGASRAQAENSLESDPAYLPIDKAFDLKVARPEVNVNLPRFLLQDALADFNGSPDDPFAKSGINLADLIKDIKLIRVLVIPAKATNREAITKGMASLRRTLEEKWTAIATVPEEHVGIYALPDASGEAMGGLALLVQDKDEAVIGNIVGRVSLGKLVKAASHVDKFPKDLLKKLGVSANGDAPTTGSKKQEKKKAK